MSIPAIVFDLGKVLVDFDYGLAVKRIAASCSVPVQEIRRALDQSPLLFEYETGQITKETFFQKICSATGYCADIELFSKHFADIFTPIPEMLELHATLQKKGFPTYIFSNTNELAVEHIQRNFPFFSGFTDYIYSYKHGAMKPDPKLYQVVEQVTGKRGGEIVYLDDRIENIQAAEKRGWRAIHHVSPQNTLNNLKALGLIPS